VKLPRECTNHWLIQPTGYPMDKTPRTIQWFNFWFKLHTPCTYDICLYYMLYTYMHRIIYGSGLSPDPPPFPFNTNHNHKYMPIHIAYKEHVVAQWSGGWTKSWVKGEVPGSNPADSPYNFYTTIKPVT
jgi:hypothetical protein